MHRAARRCALCVPSHSNVLNTLLGGMHCCVRGACRALVTWVAPLLYAKIYQKYATTKPGAPYFAAGAVCMLGELVHRSLSDKDLGLD